jgi:hypothetical protein
MAQLAFFIVAAVPLVLAWAYQALYWRRFKQFAGTGIAQKKPSLLWGNLKHVHEQIQTGGAVGDPRRHTGTAPTPGNSYFESDVVVSHQSC